MNKILSLFFIIAIISLLPTAFAEENNNEIAVTTSVEIDVNLGTTDTNEGSTQGTNEENETEEIETEVETKVEVENNEEVDEATLSEIRIMSESTIGAEMRIKQLQRAATRAELTGARVIEVLIANDANAEEVKKLSLIHAEIVLIKEEAFSLDASSTIAVEDFVAVKRSLMRAISEFRKIAAPLLTSEQKQEITASIRANSEINELNAEVIARIREANALRVENALKRIDKSTPLLAQAIRNGEITPQEIRTRITNEYKSATNEELLKARAEIRAEINARAIIHRDIATQVVNNNLDRQIQRIENRTKNIPDDLSEEQKRLLEIRAQNTINRLNSIRPSADVNQEIRGRAN